MITGHFDKNILCYGDSNVWGQTPDKSRRYDEDERWTALLTKDLPKGFALHEAGLGGRIAGEDENPSRTGKTGLFTEIGKLRTLDHLVIMLGVAETKTEYDRSAATISQSITDLIQLALSLTTHQETRSEVTLIPPPAINVNAKLFNNFYTGLYDQRSSEKTVEMYAILDNLAKQNNWNIINQSVLATGDDGLHLTPEAHQDLMKAVKDKLMPNKGDLE